jgi:probable DNA repair protein
MPFRLNPDLAAALDAGATILTPNRRIAHAIRRAFDAGRSAAGQTLWTPPAILPLDAWLADQWQRLIVAGHEDRVLLNPVQQAALWREIVVADNETPRLRSADALADLASRAWTLLCLHQGRERLREFSLSTDARAFERWTHAFERRLARAQSITAVELPSALAAHASYLARTPIATVDFESHPPAIAHLLETLGAEPLQTALADAANSLYLAEDDASEIAAAASWARNLLAHSPTASVAIVVPNLEARRAAIDRVFAQTLNPASQPIAAPQSPPLHEFSLGQPLAELPIARAALDLLAWPLEPLPLERVSALLLSPWFGAASSAVAAFDAFDLRQASLLRPELPLATAIRLVERSSRRPQLGDLLLRLRNLQAEALATQLADRPGQSEPLRQPHALWSSAFSEILPAAGWSRQTANGSIEFQQLRRWQAALDELATLDAVPSLSQPSGPEVLAALRRVLGEAVFAPESRGAPVQIMGPLEVGGVAFDALWFLGADDLNWPAPQAASPLLPWPLQRTLGMPGADRTRDDAQAQALNNRLARSAPETVFSYALHAEDGERRPSPLLAALHLQPREGRSTEPEHEALPLETILDDTALPPLPDRPVRGGAHVLKLQAACGFRAFAETRLHSTEPGSREPGLDALERGSLVHAVMEDFWTGLASQSALRALSPPEREERLDTAISRAFARLKATPETPWDRAYLAVQRRRLRDLLMPWLDRELDRSPFQVLPPEQRRRFQLGPIALDLRIDRIDLTPSGAIVLDYKTGLASPAAWAGSRPDEPQLPLYSVLFAAERQQPLAGVAFALLRAGDGLALKGFADDPVLLGGGKPARMEAATLEEQVARWHEVLIDLAEAYAAGDTRVAPKLYPKTCERCSQRMLCRLQPASLGEPLDDESNAEGESADV